MIPNAPTSTESNSTTQLNQLERALVTNDQSGWENRVSVGVFIATIAFFTACAAWTAAFDQTKVSATENRPLATFPKVRNVKKDLPKFAQGFERFYNDHFAFRMPLISTRNFILLKALDTSGDSQVTIGKNDWMFYAVPQALSAQANFEPFSETDLLRWARAIQSRKNFCAQHGINYVFFVAPEKGSILPEHLPSRLVVKPGKTRLDQLQEYLRAHTDVEVVDAKSELLKAKPKQFPIYHKQDTHWNQYGSFVVTQELLRHINKSMPETKEFSAWDYHLTTDYPFFGDLSKMLGLAALFPERAMYVAMHNEKAHPQPDAKIAPMPDCHEPSFAWVHPDSSLPRIFVLRDSFCGYLIPWLAERASFCEFHWTHRMVAPLVLAQKPNLVVDEMAERHLYFYVPENAPQFSPGENSSAASANVLATYDKKFELKNVSVNRTKSGMVVELKWRSLCEQVFDRKVDLHAMSDEGTVLASTEYDQDSLDRTVPAFSEWTDIIEIPNGNQAKIKQLGISMHNPDGISLGTTTDQKTDWGTARVHLDLKSIENTGCPVSLP